MASRCHWKFVVRDQYGYAIQNASVFVYQPGTSSAFTGTAYDAVTGGSTVTNPFTSNSQGEVEAWFDTPQRVDVYVTDNTDTAYRATASSVPISFSPFTEYDDVIQAPDDIRDEIIDTTAGDFVAAIVNPFTAVTAVAGAVGKLADAGHVHPYTALTPTAPTIPKTATAAGTSTNPARADHRHPFQAYTGFTSKFTTTSDTNEQQIHVRTVAANDLSAGSMFRIAMRGYQTNSTTAITYTFRVRWGGVAGVVVGQALAIVGTTTAHTDNPVSLDFLMTVQSIGATGSATGSWSGAECISTATANTPKLVLDVQNAAATIDTTAAKDLVLTVQMSATTGTPNLEVDNVLIEQVA